jgi:hypothetical protein
MFQTSTGFGGSNGGRNDNTGSSPGDVAISECVELLNLTPEELADVGVDYTLLKIMFPLINPWDLPANTTKFNHEKFTELLNIKVDEFYINQDYVDPFSNELTGLEASKILERFIKNPPLEAVFSFDNLTMSTS